MGFLRIVMFFLLLLPGGAFAAELGSARISLISGDVQIYTADTQDWVAAAINTPILEGDRLWVPEGARTEVQIQGGVYIRLGAATSFDILALQEESFQFYLNGGHAYINNRKGGIDHIQVDTPQSSVGCYDNSLVMIDVAQNGDTDVSVLKGYASAESRSGRSEVDAGNTLHLGSDLTAELFPLAPPDEWENWNRQRDKQLAAGNRSLRYIPEELDDYAYDLDDYGKWVYVTDYGYCWRPLSVSADWSPYRVGRWCWVRGDYVWIAYEPWGWVPYHYGRWAFVANFGWCWVPPSRGSVYWGPGYVGWVHTPTYVAWVPLAPGEIYYGRGYYGPGSVNITNVTINQTVVQNFRNVNVRNAVTVVNTNTFVSGRKEPVRVTGNPFREANVRVGQPEIKPSKTTAMPVIRDVPAARKPPERVRRVSVDQIKRERAVVREERGSVFKPGQPRAEMPVRTRTEPQKMIREQHPAVPGAKPGKRERLTPRIEQQPAAKQPDVIRGRPTPSPAKQAPEQRQPARQPEIIRGRPTPPTVEPAPERQPPAKQPDIIRGRPTPPTAEPAPQQERRQSAEPGKPTPRTRGEAPAKPQREPRWQEPTPAGKPGAQRQEAPVQQRPQTAVPHVGTPAQPRTQQP
ncbi:MAG TPA: DUF6600 domain-containing protein, partial [Geobacteraceae bacterium]|nr:DUF6600 domain-containing protein [Geobacteraceae bacterium]